MLTWAVIGLNIAGFVLTAYALLAVLLRTLAEKRRGEDLTAKGTKLLAWHAEELALQREAGTSLDNREARSAEFKRRALSDGLNPSSYNEVNLAILTNGASDRLKLLSAIHAARSDLWVLGIGLLASTVANIVPLIWPTSALLGAAS